MSLLRILASSSVLVLTACPSASDDVAGDGSTGSTSSQPTTTGPTGSTSDTTTGSDTTEGTSSGEPTTSPEESSGGPATCEGSDAPFGRPVAIMALSSASSDSGAWFSVDELTVYFASTRRGGAGLGDIYVAERDDLGAEFGEPSLVSVSSERDENRAALTADGLRMVAVVPDMTSALVLHGAGRETIGDEFGSLKPIAGLGEPGTNDSAPWISGKGDVLYFASDRGGSIDIYRSEATLRGELGEPVAVDELNSGDVETSPVASPDGLTIYFASDRPGGAGLDVYVATRATNTDDFGMPMSVGELNSESADQPSWISPDGCRLYLDRDAGDDRDIYLAERTP